MAKKETEEIEEPTLEDLEEDDIEEEPSAEEEEKEEVETESLEARVETEKKSVDDADEAEGSFMSVNFFIILFNSSKVLVGKYS